MQWDPELKDESTKSTEVKDEPKKSTDEVKDESKSKDEAESTESPTANEVKNEPKKQDPVAAEPRKLRQCIYCKRVFLHPIIEDPAEDILIRQFRFHAQENCGTYHPG